MEYRQAVILGVIQGITEFLPISSSGHLILAPRIFNFQDQGLAMDAILHLATLLAIIIVFRGDLWSILQSLFARGAERAPWRRLGWSIFWASFPAGIAGLLWAHVIENEFRSPALVACNLMFWSFAFYFADRYAKQNPNALTRVENVAFAPVLWVGFAQALALIPGTSRSGITIAAGLFGKLSQTAAARLSFLLGAPITLAAGLHKLASLMQNHDAAIAAYGAGQTAVAFATTFVCGYASIKLLLKIVANAGLLPFILYRIALSIVILVFYV